MNFSFLPLEPNLAVSYSFVLVMRRTLSLRISPFLISHQGFAIPSTDERLHEICDNGISSILSLTQNAPEPVLEAAAAGKVQSGHVGIVDFAAPTLDDVSKSVSFLGSALDRRGVFALPLLNVPRLAHWAASACFDSSIASFTMLLRYS